MVKRRIPVSNKQVNETKLIDSLNSKLLKKEDKDASTEAIKKRFPGMEKTIDSFVNVLEETLAEAENKPAADISQYVIDGLNTEAIDAYECGTEIAEDSAPNFDKIESDRQREIKYNAHADKIGYADAGPSPVWDNLVFVKELSPEALEKLEKVIGPVAKSILERFDTNCFTTSLKANEECRETINKEMKTDLFTEMTKVTPSGKKMMERCKDVAEKLTGKDLRTPKKTVDDVLPVPTECTYVVDLAADENDNTVVYEMVDHPSHYNLYDIEAIDMIERIWGAKNAALWCEITAFKYRMRMGTKPGEDVTRDLNKEQWYLKKAKELRNKN